MSIAERTQAVGMIRAGVTLNFDPVGNDPANFSTLNSDQKVVEN